MSKRLISFLMMIFILSGSSLFAEGTCSGDNTTVCFDDFDCEGLTLGTCNTSSASPTEISLSSTTIENSAYIGDTVGTLSTTESSRGYDLVDSSNYTDSGTCDSGHANNGSFSISGSSLAIAETLTAGDYTICIWTDNDSSVSYKENFTITVTETVDDIAPQITTIDRLTSTASSTNADTLVYQLIFSENVLSIDNTDFVLTGTTANLALESIGSKTYNITASGGDLASFTGVVTLGLSDGHNITDTASNPLPNTISAGINSTYILDNTPPVLIAVTPVATTTRDTKPSFVFSTNKIGTIVMGGSCGTSSSSTISTSGNTTLTLTSTDNLSALNLGTYNDCTIKVRDMLGNESTPLSISSFSVVPSPIIAEITAVTTPLIDYTPDYTFSTNQTGTLALSGSCGTSSSINIVETGNITITLTKQDDTSAFTRGIYNDCTLKLTNSTGEVSNILTLSSFEKKNIKPIITSDAITSILKDNNYTYNMTATDMDGDTLTWAVKKGTTLPNWLNIHIEYEKNPTVGIRFISNEDGLIQSVFEYSMGVDSKGYFYYIDTNNHVIKVIPNNPTSAIIVAGNNGEGDALNQLNSPSGVYVDSNDNIYIADSGNDRIMMYAPNTISGVIVAGGNGRGDALNQFYNPYDVTVDLYKNIYILDSDNNRVMMYAPNATTGTIIAKWKYDITSIGTPEIIYIGIDKKMYLYNIGGRRTIKFKAINSLLKGTHATIGTHDINLTVSDGIDTVEHNFQIDVGSITMGAPQTSVTPDGKNQVTSTFTDNNGNETNATFQSDKPVTTTQNSQGVVNTSTLAENSEGKSVTVTNTVNKNGTIKNIVMIGSGEINATITSDVIATTKTIDNGLETNATVTNDDNSTISHIITTTDKGKTTISTQRTDSNGTIASKVSSTLASTKVTVNSQGGTSILASDSTVNYELNTSANGTVSLSLRHDDSIPNDVDLSHITGASNIIFGRGNVTVTGRLTSGGTPQKIFLVD